MSIVRLNTTSKSYSTNKVMPAFDRGYFYIVVVSGSITIEFGEGGGAIPLAAGAWLEPYVAPVGQIDIVATAAVYIIHSDDQG